MNNFRELIVWQKSRELVKATYVLSENIPTTEKFGLISQIRRAVVSIPSNIAEGASRSSDKEFAHFLEIAYGSSFELETQILLCIDVNYLKQEVASDFITNIQEIQRMIYKLIKIKKS